MRVILVGANGRMGKYMAEELLRAGEQLVAAVDKDFSDIATAGLPQIYHDINTFTSLNDVKDEADVLIDFSHHTSIGDILDFALQRGLPLVIATTGHTTEELELIKIAANELPIFKSGNMSYGVELFKSLVVKVAKAFDYADVEIVETHHSKKADVPSGTALMLADAIIDARGGGKIAVGRRSGKRERGEVSISSLRLGGTVGVHEVIFDTGIQSITLRHEAHSRSLFTVGAINAMRFIVDSPAGLYSVSDLSNKKEQ